MQNRYDSGDVQRFLDALVGKLAASFVPASPLNLVGIRTRGETLAERLRSPKMLEVLPAG